MLRNRDVFNTDLTSYYFLCNQPQNPFLSVDYRLAHMDA